MSIKDANGRGTKVLNLEHLTWNSYLFLECFRDIVVQNRIKMYSSKPKKSVESYLLLTFNYTIRNSTYINLTRLSQPKK